MLSPIYRFRLHAQSSDRKMRAALKLAGHQQDSLLGGEAAQCSNGEVKEKTYTLSRHDAILARSRKRSLQDPMPSQFQDDGISRRDRRYSFTSEDRRQEALLGPPQKSNPLLSSSSLTAPIPSAIDSSPQTCKAPSVDKTRPKLPQVLALKEQRKAEKRLQKELEEKAKQARKMVKADIKDKAMKSRKKLKVTYKAASSNPEAFVAWAEAYQRLAAFPHEETALNVESVNQGQPRSSMQRLKALLPKRLTARNLQPAYTAMSSPTVPTRAIAELPVDDFPSELDGIQEVMASVSDPPANHAGPSLKGKSKAGDRFMDNLPWQAPWTEQTLDLAPNRNIQDLSLLDSSLPVNSSRVKTVHTPVSDSSISKAETSDIIVQHIARDGGPLQAEIGRLGAQAAAELRQCATDLDQAKDLRHAELKRELSTQRRCHAHNLEKLTAALKTLQHHGRKEPQATNTGVHMEHDRCVEASTTREHILARREEDLTLQLREASLREREAAMREREAASREREAASRERHAVSLAAEGLSQENQSASPRKLGFSESVTASPEKHGFSKGLERDRNYELPPKDLTSRSGKSGSVGEIEDFSGTPRDSQNSHYTKLPLRAARNTFGPLEISEKVSTRPASDHEERRALHQLAQAFVESITGLLLFRGPGIKAHAVPKRKCAGSATFTKSSGRSRPSTGSGIGQGAEKGKGRAPNEEEDDSDVESRKRRRRNPLTLNSQSRILACPYSKYDSSRYSEMNVREKCYRGCTSCYMLDISRLKQHLYRVHRRPEHHCPRCFKVFESEVLLHEHARQLISCTIMTCPFPEKLTDSQVRELKRKWTGKSTEECWYIVFKIIFPNAPKPSSPYADEKSSVIINVEAQTAPQRLGQLFREKLSQLDRAALTAQLWDEETQAILRQVVEDSMAELLRQTVPSHMPYFDAGSVTSQESQPPRSCDKQMMPDFGACRGEPSGSAWQNEGPPSLLDLDLDTADFNIGNFSASDLRNRPMNDARNSPNPFDWSEISYAQSAGGDVAPFSEWNLGHFDESIANFAHYAVETSQDNHNATGVLQIPNSILPSESVCLGDSSHFTVLPASESMGPPRAPTMQYNREPTMAVQPLQQKRSQRSLDSGYRSISTAQQNSSSENNSMENLSYLRTGIHDTLA